MSNTKKIIQIIVFVIVVLVVGYYFINEFYLKDRHAGPEKPDVTLEQVFEFKVVRDDFTQEQIDDYQERFDRKVGQVQNSPDSFNFSSLNSIGMIKKELYDFEGARDVWEYVSYMSPENSLSFFHLGNLYMEDLKDNQKAEENFLIALENSENERGNEQYYRAVTTFYTYYYTEKKQQVEKILLDVLKTELYKESFDVMTLLATYYGNNNQKEKAIEYWQKALALDPGNEAVIGEIERIKN